ncbi:hypothetical protein HYH02_001178 [Chlamydomonas schloesseri]|uniref:Protein kinase domain-containing protein n=1 Tax=Chlamydomonas schloesseri TaxID=2026947 RepID=A0A835WVF5_9CHLO|nr:hypothetical protein HYH02_001178 [Chlamydomonas schloesseri]|eukprot:KAG2454142.1 hypothetical protein HYH02_001178 [Chlamydomonas schloesseri]
MGKLLMPPGIVLRFQHVVVDRWREALYLQAPGLDLLVAWPGPKPSDPIKAPQDSWSFVVFEDMGLINRACLEPSLALVAVGGYTRPAWAPGAQTITPNISQEGCVPFDGPPNASSPRLMERCYPLYTRYDDLVMPGYDTDGVNTPRPVLNGYVLLLRNNLVKCQAILTASCIQQLGAYACYRLRYPLRNATLGSGLDGGSLTTGQQPSPPAGGGPPSTALAASSGDGDSSSVVLGAVLGGVLGGCALLFGGLAAVVLLRRRRRRQATGGGAGIGGVLFPAAEAAVKAGSGGGDADMSTGSNSGYPSGSDAAITRRVAQVATGDGDSMAAGQGAEDPPAASAPPVHRLDSGGSGPQLPMTTPAPGPLPVSTSVELPLPPGQAVVVTSRMPLQPGIPLDVVVLAEEQQQQQQQRPVSMYPAAAAAAAAGAGRAVAAAAAAAGAAAGAARQRDSPAVRPHHVQAGALTPDAADCAPGGALATRARKQSSPVAPLRQQGQELPEQCPTPPRAVALATASTGGVSPTAAAATDAQPGSDSVCLMHATEPDRRASAEISATVDAAPCVTLLPVLRGRGTFGRVVEGLYCGQRVAVKLLNTGLLAAAAERPIPAVQRGPPQQLEKDWNLPKAAATAAAAAEVAAAGGKTNFTGADVAALDVEAAGAQQQLTSGLNMLTVPGLMVTYSSHSHSHTGTSDDTSTQAAVKQQRPQPPLLHQGAHQWPHQQLPQLLHWPPQAQSTSSSSDGDVMGTAAVRQLAVTEAAVLSNRGTARRRGAAANDRAAPYSHPRFNHSDSNAGGVSALGLFGRSPPSAVQQAPRWGLGPAAASTQQQQQQQQQLAPVPAQGPLPHTRQPRPWVWTPPASDEAQSSFTQEGAAATTTPTATATPTATPTATGTTSGTNGDGTSPLPLRPVTAAQLPEASAAAERPAAAAGSAGSMACEAVPNAVQQQQHLQSTASEDQKLAHQLDGGPQAPRADDSGGSSSSSSVTGVRTAGARKLRLPPAAAAAALALTGAGCSGDALAGCVEAGAQDEGAEQDISVTHGERWEPENGAEQSEPDAEGAAMQAKQRSGVGRGRPGDVGGAAARMQHTFVQEVQILARIEHPCIVKLLAACLQPPQFALVFELMDTSLDRLLYGGGANGANGQPPPYYCPYSRTSLMPLDKVLHISAQIARALEYLHPTVIHRDLPGNVLLSGVESPWPVVKLADFGLSRLQSTVLVTRNVDVGTASYMAPETLNALNRVVTHHVDMYALGVMMWEMLAGQRPWAGANIVQIACAVGMRNARPPLASIPEGRCPPALQRLIGQCWDQDPARRPAASEVYKELLLLRRQVCGGGAVAGPGDSGDTEVFGGGGGGGGSSARSTPSSSSAVLAA